MGHLSFTFGTMGAGKTAAALALKEDLEAMGTTVWLMRPAADTRGETGMVSSRNGCSSPALTIRADFDLFSMFRHRLKDAAVIVDEAQFLLAYQVEALRRLADEADVRIHCFGIRTDFSGHLFPGAQRLLELADGVSVIRSRCECGSDAVINARIGEDGLPETGGSVYEIGDMGRYRPLCHRCWETSAASKSVQPARPRR